MAPGPFSVMRTTFLDYDARPRPKTDTFCCKCQKDIKGNNYRWVRLINGGATVLHPADEALYTPDAGDLGWHRIGSDCARKLGLEWSAANSGGQPEII